MRKLGELISLALLLITLFNIFVPISISAQTEEWEHQSIVWFYNNLTSEDRKKIRQAMDYAIPRQQIIDTVFQGLALPLATEVGQNMMGYDPSVQPREYDITKAKQLMAEVFGKIYDNSPGAKANSTHTTTPYFNMIIIIIITLATRAATRAHLATLIQTSLEDIGITVILKSYTQFIIDQQIYNPKNVGFDYMHGGFDAYVEGYSTSADPDYSNRYYPSQFAPNGENNQWIENEEVVEIINRSLTTLNLDDRLTALKEYQAWFYEWVPKSIILQVYDLFAVDPYLKGLDPYLISNFQNYTIVHPVDGLQDTLTYTIPGDLVAFNPLLSNSYYDSIVTRNIFRPLVSRRGANNLTHPVGVLAEYWTNSEDGLVWDVKLREGVQWHDGTEMTADDVVFTYQACFEEELGSPKLTFMKDRFGQNGSSNIEKIDKHNVRFTLESFYPYVTTTVFNLSILQKAQMEQIDIADWKTHKTNTGIEKLIGCGPYKFEKYEDWSTVTLVKSENYNQDKMGHDTNAVGGGIWWPNASIETVHITVVKEVATCLNGLESGKYDIIDPHSGLQTQYDELLEADWADIIVSPGYRWEELAYNHYDPRWGMNPGKPSDLYPGSYREQPDYINQVYLFFLITFFSFLILIIIVGITILQKLDLTRT